MHALAARAPYARRLVIALTDTSLIDVVTPADPWTGRPTLSRDVVPRPRLVAALAATGDGCVAVLAAPAGYGKTTLLCQWEAADARPFAWLGLDEPRRRGPGAARGAPGRRCSPGYRRTSTSCSSSTTHTSSARTRARLALGGSSPISRATTAVALATRGRSPLPLARLRAQHRLVELGPAGSR